MRHTNRIDHNVTAARQGRLLVANETSDHNVTLRLRSGQA